MGRYLYGMPTPYAEWLMFLSIWLHRSSNYLVIHYNYSYRASRL